jgi:hypothetical protein
MFRVALFTIGKRGKQCKYTLMDGQIKTIWCVCV